MVFADTGIAAEGLLGDVLVKGAGGAAFVLHNAETWQWWHFLAWTFIILLGMELLAALVHVFGRVSGARMIRPRGKHLDELEPLDRIFVAFNRCTTALFTYHAIQFLWYTPWGGRVSWHMSALDMFNGPGAFVALYVVYDLFYTVFHRILHLRGIYRYIHKHHHRQKAPTRGNVDAVNVHPFEFVSGEYNHLLALYLVSKFVVPVHVVAAAAFVVTGGFLASLNHTRFDVRIPGVYEVRYHDIHHWYPESNYGQYIMLWDWIMGSLKPYPEGDDEQQPSKGATRHTAAGAPLVGKEKAG